MTTYVLAGGCFWCIDAVFRQLRGVTDSICGYAGGSSEDANYNKVSTGRTGHAEAVKLIFDENTLPKEVLLNIFFAIHNPTSLNRQASDIGPQYRSAMFYTGNEQRDEFNSAVKRTRPIWQDPIVTEVTELKAFYPAEPEHQDFYAKNPLSGYCSVVISPKVKTARKNFSDYLKKT